MVAQNPQDPNPLDYDQLIVGLYAADARTRQQAVIGLGQLGDERALQPLLGLLNDPAAEVRYDVVVVLRRLMHPDGIMPLIIYALKDGEERVRAEAVYALGLSGDERALQPLIAQVSDQSVMVRINLAEALGRLGRAEAVHALITLLHDARTTSIYVNEQFQTMGVCDFAAAALQQIGTPEALEAVQVWKKKRGTSQL